jgi:hypothetical protein
LSDKQKWNRDFDFKTAFGAVLRAPLRRRFFAASVWNKKEN